MRKLTQEEYIKKCQEVHNSRYDYSLVEYKNTRSKIKIICPIHGVFDQLSKGHKNGQGCPSCAGNNIIHKSEFIRLCVEKNGDKYDYSLINTEIVKSSDYISIINNEDKIIYNQISDHHRNGISPKRIESKSLIKRLSKIHYNKYSYIIDKDIVKLTDRIKLISNLTKDEFLYRVDRHLQGMCPNKVTLNYFKLKSSEIHNNKYDYSLIKEINGGNDRVSIICPNHGVFDQRVTNHMNLKDGCPICVGRGKWNNELLISEFRKTHLYRFDYSMVSFENISKKVKIICKIHGIFDQNIHKHLNGQGCKLCSSNSKGEEYVKMHLEDMKIKYIQQYGFDTCRHVNKLSFDFYLPDHRTCIEFDGIQHFKPIRDFGGESGFNDCRKRDECKNKWCVENNIKLIRIKYDEISKISKIINNYLVVDKK